MPIAGHFIASYSAGSISVLYSQDLLTIISINKPYRILLDWAEWTYDTRENSLGLHLLVE